MSTIVFHRPMAPRPRRIRSVTAEAALIATVLMMIGAVYAIGIWHIASAYRLPDPVEVPGHMLSAD
jgi:hypothetical protein